MAASVSMEVNSRPLKIPKLDTSGEESKPTTIYGRLRQESDEYVRQYLLFHYDFYRTQGFGIDWEKFDFLFNICVPYDGSPRIDGGQTNEEIIEEVTLRAIAKHNEENGTNIVFVEHIEANYAFNLCMEHWLTFWAIDLSSPCPETKIYQTHVEELGAKFSVTIFRLKPTDEEMAAATPIPVNPPREFYDPPVVFSFAGPGDVPVPGTPFTFTRDPPEEDEEEDIDSGSECSCDECSRYFKSKSSG